MKHVQNAQIEKKFKELEEKIGKHPSKIRTGGGNGGQPTPTRERQNGVIQQAQDSN